MKVSHRPLNEQVMVITGASSGIGLATAIAAAKEGAKLALAARSANTLDDIVATINSAGCEAIAVVCDVSDRAQVERLADATIRRFGRIDTWVNDAAVSIFGHHEEVSEEDCRRLFDINFWGTYYGSLIALPHLKRSGGTLINIGSEVSEDIILLQGMYTASKHAVKGFTDSLRIEIEEIEEAPVSITLIQPTAVDTPFPRHARNYMDREPKLPSPTIEPERVAEAILHAAVHPTRNKKVGAMAVVNTLAAKLTPKLADKIAATYEERQKTDEPPRRPEGILYAPSESVAVAGRMHGDDGA